MTLLVAELGIAAIAIGVAVVFAGVLVWALAKSAGKNARCEERLKQMQADAEWRIEYDRLMAQPTPHGADRAALGERRRLLHAHGDGAPDMPDPKP